MTEDGIIQALRQVVEPEAIRTDAATLDLLAHDALHPVRFPPGTELAQPLCVVQPRTTAQVAAVLRFATAAKRPVIPVGGGSGLMGGAASIVPGIVLDLRQLNDIHIRPVDRMADVGAGATIAALNQAAAPHGLMCGHDPWTVAVATVGGTISTNSLGYVGGKYGAMGHQVLGLEVVLPSGDIVQTRGVEKSSTGPALPTLFIGAEGCLGVITRATLRLVPIPQERVLQSWTFADFDTGFAAINALFDVGIRPGLLDYGDEEPTLEAPPPATLMIGYEGPARVARAEAEEAAAICAQYQGQLQPEEKAVSFWHARHARGDAYAQARAAGQSWRRSRLQIDYLHVALPPSAVLQYRRESLEHLQRHGFTVYQTGLWDNAGLFSLVYASTQDAMRGDVHEALLKRCQDLHGSMEYCHGVGTRLAALMPREHGAGLDVLRRLKQSLDPHGILNPGKLGL